MKKKIFFSAAVLTIVLFSANSIHAQMKVGYFDEQKTLQLFPDIRIVDSLMQDFRLDSIGSQYDTRQHDYQTADSLYKKNCSGTASAGKSCEEALKDLNQKKNILANWYNLSQRISTAKLEQLLFPYKKKMFDALTEIIAEEHYTHVLNAAETLSVYAGAPILDNLSIRVAMKLKLPLSKTTMDLWRKAEHPAVPASKTATAPVKKK